MPDIATCPLCGQVGEMKAKVMETAHKRGARCWVQGDVSIECRCYRMTSIAKAESIDEPGYRSRHLVWLWNISMACIECEGPNQPKEPPATPNESGG